jgi:hypothetical protein
VKKIILAIFIVIALERFCHWQTAGFRPYKIVSTASSHTSPCPEEIAKTLEQPFYFLGSGNQFYAFESQDRTLVIKFLKYRRPSAGAVRTSAALAYDHLKEETGLIYANAHQFTAPLTIYDKIGIAHVIDLNRCEFFLQKKAHPFQMSKESLTAMIDLVLSQCQKGIANCDPMIERNFGLVDGRAIVIDFGSLKKNHRLKTSQGVKSELFLELLPLRTLLKEKQPGLLDYFDEKLLLTLSAN